MANDLARTRDDLFASLPAKPRARDVIDAEIEEVQNEIVRMVSELADLKRERGDHIEKSGAALLTAEEVAMIDRED